MYVERYGQAVDELDSYERKEDGSYGSMSGHKDDVAITRLIAALVHEKMEPCSRLAKEPAAADGYYRAGAGSAAVV
jgi:hypothetical protein